MRRIQEDQKFRKIREIGLLKEFRWSKIFGEIRDFREFRGLRKFRNFRESREFGVFIKFWEFKELKQFSEIREFSEFWIIKKFGEIKEFRDFRALTIILNDILNEYNNYFPTKTFFFQNQFGHIKRTLFILFPFDLLFIITNIRLQLQVKLRIYRRALTKY